MPSVRLTWPSAVDIITILPTLMTFVIQMIGDSYPLPEGQTAFVSALQADQILLFC
jgi:hypothetical protein